MFATSNDQLKKKERLTRWAVLGLCSAPLLGCILYSKGKSIYFLACPLRHFTGIPCPTCGMTRSFIAVARGNLHEAFVYHLFGPFVFFSLLALFVHVCLELLTNNKLTTILGQIYQHRILQMLCLIAYFSYYGLRLCLFFYGKSIDNDILANGHPHWIKSW